MAEATTIEKVLQGIQSGALAVTALLPLIPLAMQQINAAVEAFRAAGGTDDELKAHIAASEVKLDPIVARLLAYQVQRHPDDKD